MAKLVPLKSVPFEDESIKDTLDYKEQIIQALRTPTNQQGVDYEEMAQVLPLMTKVKQCEDESIVLEDAEHEVLVRHMKAIKFRLVVVEVYEMMKEIIEAPSYDLKAANTKEKGSANTN